MKTLTNIRIINWHYFWNETIEVKPIVFLTGINGSGKSTLIDALQIILLGDTTGRFFNKAAMDKSDRTLRGYLKGELGDTLDGGFKCLREGRFTSYIALEFFDDLNNSFFTMGIVFDSFADGSNEHRYFCLEDKIPENGFIIEKIPMEYKVLSKYFQESYPGRYQFFESNRAYQDFLKKKFGGLKDKYFSLLKKATSFSPITDITTFITEYVCDPQADIKIDTLQDNILEYKRLEVEAQAISARIQKLEDIDKTYNIYKQNSDNYIISQYIVEKCELEQSKQKLVLYKDQIAKSQARINQIDLEVADFNENLADLDRRKVALIQDKANDNTAKLTAELYDQKKDTLAKIAQIKGNGDVVSESLNKYCDQYIQASDELLHNFNGLDLNTLDEDKAEEIQVLLLESKKINKICREFKTNYCSTLTSLTKEILNSLRLDMTSFKNKVSSLAVSLTRTTQQIQKKISSLREEEISMKKGVKPYNPRLVQIKNELEKGLQEKFNRPIEVNIFADLIDIRDLSWSNAIEGYLASQKFNLFVAPKYYFDAYQILRRLLNEYQFYGTALIDQERIIERGYASENGSLAEEIVTDDEGAQAYANFLIGRLYKSRNPEEARGFGNGITKECDLYRNFALSRMNPRLYQESFIGRAVDDRFFSEKSRQLQANISALNNYKNLQNIINEANGLEVLSSGEIDSSFIFINKVCSLAGLQKTLDYIEEQLKEHDTTLIESMDRRIKDVEEDIARINDDKSKSYLEKGNLTQEIETIKNEKYAQEEAAIKERENHLENSYDPFLVNDQALPIFEKELADGKNILEIHSEFNMSFTRLQYLLNNILNQLSKQRRDYVSFYHLAFNVDAKDNDQFDNELKDFRDVKLPEYKEKIQDSYHKATQQFKDDFIFKLRNAIDDVEDQIGSLNEALKQSAFGLDLYRFTVKPSTVYKRYYDMLKDDSILDTDEDESSFVNKYKDVMEDLFRQVVDIGDGNNPHSQELYDNIKKFTDYRSYLDFDLIVYNKETGDEQRLSKMIKKKSGGETQTPFYIAVLASFAQLYHVNDEGELGNTTRIIIFDEAFSKMDRGRIKEAVKLLRHFNLQVILSAPSDKVGDISELVDETLVVLHEKNRSFVKLYAKDEK